MEYLIGTVNKLRHEGDGMSLYTNAKGGLEGEYHMRINPTMDSWLMLYARYRKEKDSISLQ
jgi:hypothetical protein